MGCGLLIYVAAFAVYGVAVPVGVAWLIWQDIVAHREAAKGFDLMLKAQMRAFAEAKEQE